MLQRVLAPESIVVLGGSNHLWTRENRLTRKLQTAGYQVIFATDEA
jgi:hypothetical protein